MHHSLQQFLGCLCQKPMLVKLFFPNGNMTYFSNNIYKNIYLHTSSDRSNKYLLILNFGFFSSIYCLHIYSLFEHFTKDVFSFIFAIYSI